MVGWRGKIGWVRMVALVVILDRWLSRVDEVRVRDNYSIGIRKKCLESGFWKQVTRKQNHQL